MERALAKGFRITVAAVIIAGLGVAGGAAHADQAKRAAERVAFRAAYAAASLGNEAIARTAAATLGDYPITPYLQYAWLRHGLAPADRDEIREFFDQNRDLPITATLHRRWIRVLGRQQRWDLINQDFFHDYADDEGHCYYLQAQMADGWMPRLSDANAELWLHPASRPKACDPVFAHWLKSGQLDDEMVIERLARAVNAGNLALADYLLTRLSPAARPTGRRLIDVTRDPVRHLPQIDVAQSPLLYQGSVEAMLRLARRSNEQALTFWPKINGTLAADADRIERELALFRATDYEPDSATLLAALKPDVVDDQIVQWRLRVALVDSDWDAVRHHYERHGANGLEDSKWRFWYAVALRRSGASEASNAILGELAQEANYHGFLAADMLGANYSICPASDKPTPADTARAAAEPGVVRAMELFHVGQSYHARREWSAATADLSASERRAAAHLAAASGWSHQAILTLAASGHVSDYAQRFPTTYAAEVHTQAQRFKTSPTLPLALMRAESALAEDAVSSADALGLMQLTLPTARAVAQRNGLPRPTRRGVLDPERNIELGVAHLAELEREYAHPLKMLAAYNAGPDPLEEWLSGGRLPVDGARWIESLPYHETREYIPRVLAFQVIYQWLLDGHVTRISAYQPHLDQTVTTGPRALGEQVAVNCPR